MVVPLAVSGLINESATGCKWPAVRVELGVRRGRLPLVRCSLSIPGRRTFPLQNTSNSPGSVWFGSSGLWTKGFKAALEYHQKASAATLQTLQRVGTMIRSTSMDYIAALGTKKALNNRPSPDQQPPEGGDQEPTAGQLKASLSRFLTTASKAEVSQAAMMADLSNMAYDVEQISERGLQDTHNLTLVTHSKAGHLPAVSAGPEPAAEPASPVLLQASLELQQGQTSLLYRPQSPASTAVGAGMPQSPAAAGAVPVYFSNYAISSSSQLGSAPASPRTPFVLSSFTETDDFSTSAAADMQLATASGAVNDPGTPRRRASALATSSSNTRTGAPPALEVPTLQRSSSAGVALAVQLMQYQQQDLEAPSAFFPQHQLPPGLAEQHAMLELQQQEQQVLLEMQQTQQLQLLLQQEQAIMQQLQEQASVGGDNSVAPPADASGNSAWWWLQQLQQHAAAAAAAATGVGSSNMSSSSTSNVEHPPADWFVCDGPGTATSGPVRYIVIQGSISLDHWRINLTIDPCEFENGALGGVKVHRGVYEAALQMYDTFVPFVREHLAKHPDGKVAFSGHSLGGSLATLLMLLLVHRGVLPAANMDSVLTFGSPAIFCEGATGSTPSAGACNSCSLPCQHRAERSATSAAAGAALAASNGAASPSRAPSDNGLDWKAPFVASGDAADSIASAGGGLLERLGLAPESVVNVIMARDVVPRAFVCDYTLVADVLKSWVPSFKEHVGLASCKAHKALYNFIGAVEVLQPSLDCPFVLPDEAHSMLPQEAALYKLTEPCCNLPEPSPLPAAAAPGASARLDLMSALLLRHTSRNSECGSCSGCGSNNSCSGCCGSSCSRTSSPGSSPDGSPGKPENKVKGKLSGFGSWGSLASLGSTSLTSVIADLTSTFTLVTGNIGSVASVPVTADEAAADAAALAAAAAAANRRASAQCAQAAAPTEGTTEQAVKLDELTDAAVVQAGDCASAFVQVAAAAAPLSATADPLNLTLGDAILTFMNSPHPLETLGEMRAYGPAGSISRFHNPQSYTIALQHLVGK